VEERRFILKSSFGGKDGSAIGGNDLKGITIESNIYVGINLMGEKRQFRGAAQFGEIKEKGKEKKESFHGSDGREGSNGGGYLKIGILKRNRPIFCY